MADQLPKDLDGILKVEFIVGDKRFPYLREAFLYHMQTGYGIEEEYIFIDDLKRIYPVVDRRR